MSESVQNCNYQGFDIVPVSKQLRDTGEWTLEIQVWRHGHESKARKFSAGNSFPTRDEAVRQCFIYGKHIIDGEIPGFSVDDL